MKKAYMIVNELDVNKGGMTTAMLTRSKMFLNNNIQGDIITFDYKVDYKIILEKLKKSKKMDERTKMLNPFIYFEEKSNDINTASNPTIYKNLSIMFNNSVEIKEKENISRFFNKETGEYIAYKHVIGTNDEYFFDLFKNNSRYKRIHFYNSKIHKIEMFNKENKLTSEQFFDENCYMYIYRQINPKGTIGKTYLINEKRQFNNNVDFCSYFLEEIIEDSIENTIICDGPGSFPKMLETNHKVSKKYAVIHINHYKNFDDSGAVKKHEDYILKNAEKITGIIVLTEAQKQDIIKEYNIDNAIVISNFINIPEIEQNSCSSKIVGHISRLVPQKGLTYLINVAEKVATIDSEIEFHIYGEGEEKLTLKNMIEEKKLKNVKLLGYTNNPQEKIKSFGCVISTSQFEGQGLSILEAMLLEKPVVAFDVKYGPSDFIRDQKNGYLIENKDTETMKNKIIELLNNKKLASSFGKEGRNTIIELYEPSKLLKKWEEIL